MSIRKYSWFALLAVVLAACATVVPSIGGVDVTPAAATVVVGETVQLDATITDVVATPDLSVTWASDADGIAMVDADGLVTAVAVGTANITATSVFDATKFGTAVITVAAAPAVTDVTIATPSTTDLGVTASTTVDLDATVTAVGGASTAVSWSSDDEAVATVDADGVVTSVGAGSATITATSAFDAAVFDEVVLTVHAAPTAPEYGDVLADAGTAIDQAPSVAASGGFGALTYALDAGATLPDGLAVDAATGAIQGTSYDIAEYAGVVVTATDALGQRVASVGFEVDLALVLEYLYNEGEPPFTNQFTFDDPAAFASVVNGVYVFINGVEAFVEGDPIGNPGVFDTPNPLLPFTFEFDLTSVINGNTDPESLDAWDVNTTQGTIFHTTGLTPTTYDDGPWTFTVTITADGAETAEGVAISDYVGDPVVAP